MLVPCSIALSGKDDVQANQRLQNSHVSRSRLPWPLRHRPVEGDTPLECSYYSSAPSQTMDDQESQCQWIQRAY